MPFIKIWIHAVWSTKHRVPSLMKGIRWKIFEHIKDKGKLKGIHVDFVNGHVDHVHCLLSLKATQDIATVVQLLKGECSHWVNKHNLLPEALEWQGDYFTVSVSESGVNAIREYIKNREAHHSIKTFQEVYDEFIRLYGFNKDE